MRVHLQRSTRRLHAVRKQPGPVLSPRMLPWEESLANPQVIYDPERHQYRLWCYSSGPAGLEVGYAESDDGIDWARPNLGLVEIDGSTENNLCDSPGRVGCGLMYCPEMRNVERPEHLFKMLSWLPLDGKSRFAPLFSGDGFCWQPLKPVDEPQGVMGSIGDTGTACKASDTFPLDSPDLPGKYLAFPRMHVRVGRFRRRATGFCYSTMMPGQPPMSEWSDPVAVLVPDFIDDAGALGRLEAAGNTINFLEPEDVHTEFYGMLVFRYEGLFLGLVWVFDVAANMDRLGAWNQHGTIHTQLAASRDLIHWERVGGREPMIPLGRPGEWDAGLNHFCSYPVPVGDELRIYYGGQAQPHPMADSAHLQHLNAEIRSGRLPAGITFGTLRRDGFVSLDAGEQPGTVVMAPQLVTGELHLNADARGGHVVAAICTPDGNSIEGFEESNALTGDAIHGKITWPGDRRLGQLEGVAVCVRLTATDASLYSFWFA